MRLNDKIKNLYKDKKIRFLFVGVLNTAVGYGLYALFIFFGWHYIVAQTLSTLIGVAHSYVWNKYFTFGKTARSFKEALRFVSVYVVSYLISLLLQYLMIDKAGMSAYIAGLISLVFTTVISYVGHNFYSFGNFPKKKEKSKENGENIK